MSSNSNFINNSDNAGWTEVRSKNLIKKCADKNTSDPVVQAAVTQAPVTQAPVTQAPVNQAPVNQAPVTQAPVTQAPVTQAPVTLAPVTQVPINTIPVIQPFFMENGQLDWWHNLLHCLKINKALVDNQIQYVSSELQFPVWLRGKPMQEKNNLINENLYNVIDKMLFGMKEELVNNNKWIDTINPRKITGMIIEAYDMIQKLNFLNNYVLLSKEVKDSCQVLFEKSISIEVQTNTVSNVELPKDKVSNAEEKETHNNENNIDKKFSYSERVEHKQSLLAAQETFFESCILSESDILSLKENISSIKNWSGVVNTIQLSDDEIKIKNYSFSKKHFLKNSWFKNRLMEKYCSLFGFNNVDLVLPTNKSNVLIIEGSV